MKPDAASGRARERELFLAALEKPAAERSAFLADACGDDLQLRIRVEELLREEQRIGAFLETPAAAVMGPSGTAVIAVTEKAGDRIGRYKLLQQIGEGGCGVVYMAEQEEPVRRRVALKIIKLGMDTRSVIARFEAERQALAMMDHPNIAKVLDAGATETGRPYFVMELVRGIRITEYCDQNNLPPEERLELFIQVCHAIQHAHQKGIIHRDIKPSNILITLHDGVPVPKVIDFGIAKATEQRLTDKTLFTAFTAFIGTPAYMSPEQAEMSGLDVDTRSDVYSLGVLLYELLTGKTPFDAETLLRSGLDECRRTIREQEPQRPSTRLSTMLEAELTTTASQRRTDAPKLIHLLQGDLDWIVMKCLEKDRTRRYDTATALAMDVRHYLNDEPVLARPPSNIYRLKKLLRRHRGAVAAAAAVAASLLAGTAISSWLAVRALRAERLAYDSRQQETELRRQAEREKTRAEQGEAAAKLNEYVADVNLAQQSLAAENLGRAVQLLERHIPAPGERDLRGFEWRYLWQLCQGNEHETLPLKEGPAHDLACSPDGQWLAISSRHGLSIWNLATRSIVTNLTMETGRTPGRPTSSRPPPGGRGGMFPFGGSLSASFLPDGHTLVAAGFGPARIWRTSDWAEQSSLPGSFGPITLSKDGKRLAAANRDGVRVWNTSNWQPVAMLTNVFKALALSPDGRHLVTTNESGLVVLPTETRADGIVLEDSANLFASVPWLNNDRVVAFSPDGESVVAAQNTLSQHGVFVLRVWDAATGRELASMPAGSDSEHSGMITSVAFSPDGQRLATASMDFSIRLWDFATRQRTALFQGHRSEVQAVVFSSDGNTLISSAPDGVKVWPIRPKREEGLPGTWQPLGISSDSRTLAALNREGTVAFLNLATGQPEQQIQLDARKFRFPSSAAVMSSVAVSADLKTLAQALDDGSIKIWNTETLVTHTLDADREEPVEFVELTSDGRTLLTGGFRRKVRVWDVRRATNVVLETDAHRVVLSPDSRIFAAFERGNTVGIWDLATRTVRTNLVMDAPLRPETGAAFSPDGTRLAVAGWDDVIRLLNVTNGTAMGSFVGHKQSVWSVVFSPDGNTLATASDDSTLKLWNVATQQELLTVRRLGGALRGLVFSPDGQVLAGGGSFTLQSGGIRFYRAPLITENSAH